MLYCSKQTKTMFMMEDDKKKQQKYAFINFLKVIAILLITNSHFKPIYEGIGSNFAWGGAMGCSIFFFCSGFTTLWGRKKVFFTLVLT